MYLVRVFYVVSFVWVVQSIGQWRDLVEVEAIEAQWPVRWIDLIDIGTGIKIVLIAYLVDAVVVLLAPEWRIGRVAYTITLLEFMAIENGFGKVNHSMHAWLFVASLFVLLPDRRWSERRGFGGRHQFLSVISAAQVLILFTYTLTGLWKVAWALGDLTTDRLSAFHIDAFSLVVADRLLETNEQTVLGEYIIDRPILGWVLLNGTMYLESRVAARCVSAAGTPDLGLRSDPLPPRHRPRDGVHVPAEHRARGPAPRRLTLRARPRRPASRLRRHPGRAPRPPIVAVDPISSYSSHRRRGEVMSLIAGSDSPPGAGARPAVSVGDG